MKNGKLLVGVSILALLLALCTGFAYAEGETTGIINGDTVNLRAQPNTSSAILVQLAKGTKVTVTGGSNGWYGVKYGNTAGWIAAQYVSLVKVENTGTILADSVNLRNAPGLNSQVITRLNEGEKVSVLGRSVDWYKVQTVSKTVGWVYKDFVSVSGDVGVSRSDIEVAPDKGEGKPKAALTKGEEIVQYAKQFLGVKYVYGGSSPQGFDCSGFTSYVYKHFGISIQRVAANQAKQGTYVKKEELKPGDLVFFDTDGGRNYINHVGIYIGDGNFIHASSGRNARRVVISDLSSGFYKNAYMTARRFVE